MTFSKNMVFADKMDPVCLSILTKCHRAFDKHSVIHAEKASFIADTKYNADYIVYNGSFTFRIGSRIRRYKAYKNSFLDITIRTRSKYGHTTEYDKLRENHGNFLLYGFSNAEENDLVQFVIIDLRAFNLYIDHLLNIDDMPIKKYNDDTTAFYSFDLLDMINYDYDIIVDGSYSDLKSFYIHLSDKLKKHKKLKVNDVVTRYGII